MSKKEDVSKNNAVMGIILVIVILIIVFIYFGGKSDVAYETPDVERPHKGDKDAQLVLVEYSDFACPACGRAAPEVKKWLEKYGDKLKFEYRHFPLTSIHSNAFSTAVASECANDQGKFWEYHDKLFEVNNNDKFTDINLKEYAVEVGLNVDLWQSCVDSEKREKIVKSDSLDARRLGLNSTPSFLLNDKPVARWTDLDKILEMELDGGLEENNEQE